MGDWGIIGHKRTLSMLTRAIESGRINHAYLLSGVEGIGKTTLALALARALICPSPEPPCNECRTCRAIDKETHPDVRLLRAGGRETGAASDEGAASNNRSRSIRIEQIRELQHDSALLPYEGKWKVYVIRNAEDMTMDAANCLLKTLEEPPSSVVLILTCSDAKILPATIVSRCQQVSLWPLAVEDIREALRQRWSLSEEQARLLAHLSDGRIGWALNAANDENALDERETRLQRIVGLTSASRAERFRYAEEVASSFGRDPDMVFATLDLWLSWWRDMLVVKTGCHGLATNINMLSRLPEQAMKYTVEQMHSFLVAIEAARRQLEQNVNPRLALEVMMLEVPQAGK